MIAMSLAHLGVAPGVVTALDVLLLCGGCVPAALAAYLLVLSIAAFFYRDGPSEQSPRSNLLVLVPAHDESLLIARCVTSLCRQTYPRDRYTVVVIADNCSDDTASIASAAGADVVMERDEPAARGKGQALRWALDRLLQAESPPDAVVMVDADSVASPDLLQALARRLDAGEPVVQGAYLLWTDDPRQVSLSAISFMLVNSVRPAGLTVLGLPGIHLAGNGMLFARDVLLNHPWTAFSSTEDAEYGLILQSSGIRITFAREALVEAPPAPSGDAAEQQRLRWHGGKVHLARRWTLPLLIRAVRERRLAPLASALSLVLPPIGLLAAALTAGCAVGSIAVIIGLLPVWVLAPWVGGVGLLVAHVILGLTAAGAPRAAFAALVRAPRYILHTAVGVGRVWRFQGDTWVRTEREQPRGVDEPAVERRVAAAGSVRAER